MNILDIIEKKKNKQTLTKQEIDFFVNGFVNTKEIRDYQASSLLMAILLNGLDDEETYNLTNSMLNSGELINLKSDKLIIDKHSSGGVGDKITLIINPILSSLDINVAMISGRGLSFTGGTLDKIESIGSNSNFNIKKIQNLMDKYGFFIASQTDNIVPADKEIYALRDASGTVNSIPLVASSIISKKVCINSDYLFLDIKVGNGSFFKTIDAAENICKTILSLTKRFNKKTIINLTNMESPLGYAIGNKLEMIETFQFLLNEKQEKDLKELVYEFVSSILLISNKASNKKEAYKLIDSVINNQKAFNVLNDYLKETGSLLDLKKYNSWYKPKYKYELKSNKNGFVFIKNAMEIGLLSVSLGAGRLTKDDLIDFDAGLLFNVSNNDFIKQNDLIVTLYSNKQIDDKLVEKLKQNIEINEEPKDYQMIYKVLNNL